MKNYIINKKECIMFCGLFVFFVILWIRIYPIMVADPDDWTYISFSRQAVPAWKSWNPSKIFPETFMSLCGQFATFVVFPIIEDWSMAMTVTYAIVNALLVTIYVYLFDKLITKIFTLSFGKKVFVDFFFVCTHFWIFKTHDYNNSYVFMSQSLNTQMNYRIPMFMAIGLLLFAICRILDGKPTCKNGWVILWLILCIFSNLTTNILIVVPAFCICFYNILIAKKQNTFSLMQYIKENSIYLLTLILEIVCMIFEFFGGRAESLPFEFGQAVRDTLVDIKSVIKSINILLAIVVLLLIIVFFCINRKRNDSRTKIMMTFLVSGLLCSVYTVLLLARVGMHKLTRADNVSVMAIFFLLAGSMALATILEKTDKFNILLPILAYIMFFSVTNTNHLVGNYFERGGNLYYGAHSEYATAADCYEANAEILEQFVDADKNGVEEIDLYLPEVLAKYSFAGTRIETTLYRQGIIRKHMKVNVISK